MMRSIGGSEVIDTQKAIMDICSVGIVPGIDALMADRAGNSHAINTEKFMVDIASIGVHSSVIVLIVDCVRSVNVVNIMEAMVDIASIGCKCSGVSLTVDCAGSTDVIDGVKPAVGNTFAGIVSLTIVSKASGETIRGAEVTVEGIMGTVVSSAIDYAGSNGGAESVKILVGRFTAEPSSLSSVVAMEVIKRVARPAVVDSIGATKAMNHVLKCLVAMLVACIWPFKAVKGV